MTKHAYILSTLAIVVLLLAGVPAAAAAAPRPGTTIVVNTTADEFGSGSDCSLREAIQAANTNSAYGGCPAGSSTESDYIILSAGVYLLTRSGANEDGNATGDLDIQGDLSVTGYSEAATIIDGGGLDRVVHVISGDVLMVSLSIRNGHAPDGAAVAAARAFSTATSAPSSASRRRGDFLSTYRLS